MYVGSATAYLTVVTQRRVRFEFRHLHLQGDAVEYIVLRVTP